MKRVYIILVNWNGWADTIECLESLLPLKYADHRVVVVDNASTDCSADYIATWSRGDLDLVRVGTSLAENAQTGGRSIDMKEYTQVEAESSGCAAPLLTLIKSDENRGFAAGNNIGLRFVLARGDADYVWLLNNDTVVDPAALTALVGRMQQDEGIGICGSTLLFYERPTYVQALAGGYFSRWFAVAWHLGQRRLFVKPTQPAKVERYLSYIVGASMLVSMDFLTQVGLMAEDYFLYFEEMDWMMRAQGRFKTGYAPDSIVYHKVGKSIGTRSHPGQKSLICDYYNLRNRLVFTWRYFPYALPTVYLGLFFEMLLRVLFGRWQNAKMAFRLLVSGRKIPPLSHFQNERG